MSPQRKGTVSAAVEKRLAELARLSRETDAELRAALVKEIKGGLSYREAFRITGIQQSTLQRWVKAAGGLERAEADRAYHAERRRILDELITPEARALIEKLDRKHRGEA